MTEWAIKTDKLGRRFGRKWAVKDMDLKVATGSVFGLLGPNGSGKSTTINMLMGLLPATEGKSSMLGINPAVDDVAVRKRVGYVAEHHGFYEWMTVDETIDLVAPYHVGWDAKVCRELQDEFDLDGDTRIKALSKGMRAKLALLLALSFDPEMLVLDEPTGGLDPAARRGFIETILGRYQEAGKTIFVSSHLLNEFAGLLDRVAFMRNGKLETVTRLDDLHARMKRVRLVFEGAPPENLLIPGARSVKSNGREAAIVMDCFDPATSPQAFRSTGATNVTVEELTLEDIFVELVGS